MIYLHKLLPLLLSPLVIVIALIFYGTIARRRKVTLVALALLYLASMPIVASGLFRVIEGPAYRLDPKSLPNADAIVVLSGMLSRVDSPNGIVYEWGDPDRFFGGIELFKLSKSERLIFTAGTAPWYEKSEPEGVILRQVAKSMGVPEDSISLTDIVENTEDEAAAVRKLLAKPGASVLLVTSAFHMPRSIQVFEKQGLRVIPYPVDFRVEISETTPMDFLPSASALSTTTLAIREQLGRTYYKIKFSLQ